jgi:phosphatidylethanolamine/phosphatidyl-N-methylethanolamine N-methyltransferase
MANEGRALVGPIETGRQSPGWLFFRRFLAHPFRLAAVTSSSRVLSRLVAKQIRPVGDGFVLELGAGTGAVTRALLAAGVPTDRLIAAEIDAEMAQFLRGAYPGVSVVEGCAFKIKQLLPPMAMGRVGAIVCGIPVSLLPFEQQRELIGVMLSLLLPGGPFLMYTHRLGPPLPARKLGLVGKRLAFTLKNFPPASVWGFRADGEGQSQGGADAEAGC